jgi:tetratricopeptide (TPR) repeat protein
MLSGTRTFFPSSSRRRSERLRSPVLVKDGPFARRALAFAVFIAALVLGSGCASSLQSNRLAHTPGELARPVELTEIPFFPQEVYQCGPAALATVLNAAGASVSPEALAPQVYLPERRGSLQLELIAATRRQGYVPYVLEPQLADVLSEVAVGNPVLVLQNLGLKWYAKWHYAVVVGFDLSKGVIILRSGRESRHVVSLKLFERTWRRGGYWAMLATAPGQSPATAVEEHYVRAIMGLERVDRWQEAAVAYTTALSRWPHSRIALLGLGNSHYALGDLVRAEAAYREAIHYHPTAAPLHNNLAQVLAEQGRLQEAGDAAREAVRLGGPLLAQAQHTLQNSR